MNGPNELGVANALCRGGRGYGQGEEAGEKSDRVAAIAVAAHAYGPAANAPVYGHRRRHVLQQCD